MKRVLVTILALALLIGGVVWWAKRHVDPPVGTIVASSLSSLQEQNRLSAFAARFVTVVTSRKEQLGFAAEKTLILPAMVRYEVDLAKLTKDDLAWNADTKSLTITLPPVEISGPEFALDQTKEYGSGAVLMALTDVEKLLDQSNRAKAKTDVLKQAQAATMIKLAQDATIRAVAQSFALPMKAAGVEANVKAEFRQ
jgi:Protein of unknown function (DUF4230)